MTVDAVAWMCRRDVPADAGDSGDAHLLIDPEVPLPLHMIGLARLGMPLIAEVEELVEDCFELGALQLPAQHRHPACAVLPAFLSNPQAIFSNQRVHRTPTTAAPATPSRQPELWLSENRLSDHLARRDKTLPPARPPLPPPVVILHRQSCASRSHA